MKFLQPLAILLCLCHVSLSQVQRKTYIVHMAKSEMSASFSDRTRWHDSSLKSVSDLAEMLYTYTNVVHGFSVQLTAEEARSFGNRRGVLSVLSEVRYELHMTRTPEFLWHDGKHWATTVLSRNPDPSQSQIWNQYTSAKIRRWQHGLGFWFRAPILAERAEDLRRVEMMRLDGRLGGDDGVGGEGGCSSLPCRCTRIQPKVCAYGPAGPGSVKMSLVGQGWARAWWGLLMVVVAGFTKQSISSSCRALNLDHWVLSP